MQEWCQENTSMPIKKTMHFWNVPKIRHLNFSGLKGEIRDGDAACASSQHSANNIFWLVFLKKITNN